MNKSYILPVGVTLPSSSWMKVDFPHPLGPTSATRESIERSKPRPLNSGFDSLFHPNSTCNGKGKESVRKVTFFTPP